jgi:hypothetical protein
MTGDVLLKRRTNKNAAGLEVLAALISRLFTTGEPITWHKR